jgi:hypothetical protein
MNLLVVYGCGSENLKFFSQLIAGILSDSDSIQILPAGDVTAREWRWADCLILGVSWNAANVIQEQDGLHASLSTALKRPKMFALFQLQSRTDPPISAAYGYALGRQLREAGMVWVAPPIVFFGRERTGDEFEGELLRAGQWFADIATVADGMIPQDI